MNILLVADVSIANVIGGAERVVYEQSKQLVDRGHTVHLLTRKLSDHKYNKDEINGVIEWRYNINTRNSFLYLVSTIRNAKTLFTTLQNQYRYDGILFYQPFSSFGVITSKFSNASRKIYICFSLSFEEFLSRNVRPDNLLRKIVFIANIFFRRFIEKWALKKSKQIIVLSKFTEMTLWDAYNIAADRISIVPGGIDLEKFYPVADKVSIRKRLNVPQGKTILFTVRNMVQRMGLESLITAMKKVSSTAPDIYLVIGGHGPIKDDLIDLTSRFGLEGQIEFAGFIHDDVLPDYYRMADLFILPTKELEGFGLVTLEAMASGVPVVGTPVGGTLEILGKFDSEFIFKDTTPEAMAELIIEKYRIIKQNPDKWIEISKNCRKFVEDNYSWEKNVDALEKIMLA